MLISSDGSVDKRMTLGGEDYKSHLSQKCLWPCKTLLGSTFDLGFLREEYRLSNMDTSLLDSNRKVYDTLKMARRESPGKRNSLDALCGRYSVDNTNRDLHGALLDAKLLASVYLKMTQGQTSIVGLSESTIETSKTNPQIISSREQKIIYANKSEIESHQKYFQK